jgi:hypothetical protein
MIEVRIHESEMPVYRPETKGAAQNYDRRCSILLRQRGIDTERQYASSIVGMDGDRTYVYRQYSADELKALIPNDEQIYALAVSIELIPAGERRAIRKLARTSDRPTLQAMIHHPHLSDAQKTRALWAMLCRELLVKGIVS